MKTREQVITEFKKDMGVKTGYTLTDDENYFVDKIVEAYGLVKESDSLPCVRLSLLNQAKDFLSNEGYGTGSNFTMNSVANLMAEYAAKSKADNLPLLPVIETAVDCLRKIADPISHMRKQAEESGGELNGVVAIVLSNDANYLKKLATDWLQTNSR